MNKILSKSSIDKPDTLENPTIEDYQEMMDRVWSHLSSIIGQAATVVVFQNGLREIQGGSPCLKSIKVDHEGVSLKTLVDQEEPVEETLILRSLLAYFEGITTVLINLTGDMLIRQVQPLIKDIKMNTSSNGLPTRFLLEKVLRYQVVRANQGEKGALLLMRLDNDNLLNVNIEHFWKDHLLKELSDVLMSQLRKNDFLARFKENEFALVLNDVSEQDVKIIIRKLSIAVGQHEFIFKDISYNLSLSFDVIMLDGSMDAQQVLNRADNSLYPTGKDEINQADYLETTERF